MPLGKGTCGYDFGPLMKYIFLIIWLSISLDPSLLHSAISWGCCGQMYRSLLWGDLDSQFLSSHLLAVYPGCRQLMVDHGGEMNTEVFSCKKWKITSYVWGNRGRIKNKHHATILIKIKIRYSFKSRQMCFYRKRNQLTVFDVYCCK